MKKNTRSHDEEELCINCVNATCIDGGDACVCAFKGAVKADGCCKKFKLDLLKVTPNSPKPFAAQGQNSFFEIFGKVK